MRDKQRIIFVTNYPIDKRDSKRFGFEILQESGYEVFIWDVSKLYYSNVFISKIDYYQSNFVEIKKFVSLKQIKFEVNKMKNSDILLVAGTTIKIQSIKTFLLHKMLSHSVGIYSAVFWGDHPIHDNLPKNKNILRGIKRIIGFFPRILKKNYITSVIWREINNSKIITWGIRVTDLISPLHIIWMAALENRVPKISLDKNTILRFIHNLDYDAFLETELKEINFEKLGNYVVILDSMGPLAHDYVIESRESKINLSTYSQLIKEFMYKFEIQTGQKILIAAHPKSDLEVTGVLYGGAEVFFHRSSDLVSQAKAVISIDGSTAIGFAVMWKKPLIILNSSLFDLQGIEFNKLFSSLLGAIQIDLDSDYSIPTIRDIDDRLYEDYQNKFIKKHGTPKTLFWKVVVEDLKVRFPRT
jgi:hypothetical protein